MRKQKLDLSFGEALRISSLNQMNGGMSIHAERVAVFAMRGGQDVSGTPKIPEPAVLKLRCLLLLEETLEFIAASGFKVELHTVYSPACRVGDRFGYTVFETGDAPSYEAMVDACADVSVVNTGTLLTLGAGDLDVLAEVDFANLDKVSGEVKRDANGKIQKPEGWQPPSYRCVEEFKRMESNHFQSDAISFKDIMDPDVEEVFGEGIPLLETKVEV